MNANSGQGIELTGYVPGSLGRMVEMLASYYGEAWGWGVTYEVKVAHDISAFLRDFSEHRDLLRFALVEGKIAGSIAIDGREGNDAWLRWFIVDPAYRGLGIGALLLDHALLHARNAGFDSIWLHTFSGLTVARSLYESRGFRLVEESSGDEHGGATPLTIQTFVCELRP